MFFINQFITKFIESYYFLSLLASLIIFGFYNVRKKAHVFAGDVGSVSIAFIISFLLLKLILQTQSIIWILWLSVYGIDTVTTICFRIIRHENIFKAHRSHFYQFLANEMKINHVTISCLYAWLQLMINFITIYSFMHQNLFLPFLCLFILIIFYLTFRFKLEGKQKLLMKY